MRRRMPALILATILNISPSSIFHKTEVESAAFIQGFKILTHDTEGIILMRIKRLNISPTNYQLEIN